MRISYVLYFCIFLLIQHKAFANNHFLVFGKTLVEFGDFETENIMISGDCIKKSKIANCEAYKTIKSASYKKIKRPRIGGINAGALMCEQQFDGIVLIGIDNSTHNENSVCKLSDGSMIDNGTLIFYGLKNDKAITNSKHYIFPK